MTSSNPRDLRSLLVHRALGDLQAQTPSVPAGISMADGWPDPRYFPIEELLAAAERVLRREGGAALQYGRTSAAADLREVIAAKVRREDHRDIALENITVTGGSHQALGLLFSAFLEPGDALLLEAPSYSGAFRLCKIEGLQPVGIPVDESGMCVDELEARLPQLRRDGRLPRLLYTIPTFHNPTGTELSLERRKQLVYLAAKWGFAVIEDETYRDLRYDGEPVPSLFSLDKAGMVIKLGTFSKTIVPGVRLGWVVGDNQVIAAIGALRTDLGISPWLAQTVAEYASGGVLEQRIRRLNTIYREKRDGIVTALAERCPPTLKWQAPRGGFFVWCQLPTGLDSEQVAARSQQQGLRFYTGPVHFPDGLGHEYIRLSFGTVTQDEIARGVAILANVLSE